jgi:arylsulfatase A-like enzyme
MRKRSIRRGAFSIGMIWLVVAGCGPRDSLSTWPIVARWGDDSVRIAPARKPIPIRIEGGTRTGLCVNLGDEVESVVPGPVDELRLSTAIRGYSARTARPIPLVLRIRHWDGDAWRPLAERTISSAARGWQDTAYELPRRAPRTLRVRFDVHSDGPGVPVETCFGGVLFARRNDGALQLHPNVILVSLDTLGASYLSSFGGPPEVSPHLDALLEASYSFRRAFADSQSTFISHSSLFSALHPARHRRYLSVATRGPSANPLESLVSLLATHGYHTAAFTEDGYVASTFGFARGFDQYDDGQSDEFGFFGNAATTLGRAAEWLETFGGRVPFFVFLHTYEVHAPYRPRDAPSLRFASSLDSGSGGEFLDPLILLSLMNRQKAGESVFSEAAFQRMRALYSGEIHYLDAQLRGFLDQLEERDLLRNTLVVVTSDHGELFGEHDRVGHGGGTHNRVFHVPLAFYWKNHIAPGASEHTVQLVDILPTVLDLVGIDVPGGLDGRSLGPVIRGDATSPPNRPALSELFGRRETCAPGRTDRSCYVPLTIAQTARFKLVRATDGQRRELFDLQNDPEEEVDVSSAHPSVVDALEIAVEEYDALRPRPKAARRARDADSDVDADTWRRLEELGYVE